MAFTRKVGWRAWFREAFLRQGVFSLRGVPSTEAERELAAEKKPLSEDMTRQNIESHRKG